jgi:diketogulonate reductase-like aldo/keto reductase
MMYRRQMIKLGTALLALPSANLWANAIQTSNPSSGTTLIQNVIPSSGELIPAVGMGTASTFDTNNNPQTLAQLGEIMRLFFAGGGTVIDSSPMYGHAESRLGEVMAMRSNVPDIFAATKVWTQGKDNGIAQMHESAKRMGVTRFDLMAIHNLKDWHTHLDTLKQWKAEGKVRYIGITTWAGNYHPEFLQIMRNEPLDFVQFSYSIVEREAEKELLPVAAERGIATMINRPFQRGELFKHSKDKPLPELAHDLGCKSWGQFYLKFVLGHPAVTCVIPATSKARHMTDNMGANYGPLPNSEQRTEMLRLFDALQA